MHYHYDYFIKCKFSGAELVKQHIQTYALIRTNDAFQEAAHHASVQHVVFE